MSTPQHGVEVPKLIIEGLKQRTLSQDKNTEETPVRDDSTEEGPSREDTTEAPSRDEKEEYVDERDDGFVYMCLVSPLVSPRDDAEEGHCPATPSSVATRSTVHSVQNTPRAASPVAESPIWARASACSSPRSPLAEESAAVLEKPRPIELEHFRGVAARGRSRMQTRMRKWETMSTLSIGRGSLADTAVGSSSDMGLIDDVMSEPESVAERENPVDEYACVSPGECVLAQMLLQRCYSVVAETLCNPGEHCQAIMDSTLSETMVCKGTSALFDCTKDSRRIAIEVIVCKGTSALVDCSTDSRRKARGKTLQLTPPRRRSSVMRATEIFAWNR